MTSRLHELWYTLTQALLQMFQSAERILLEVENFLNRFLHIDVRFLGEHLERLVGAIAGGLTGR